ncbi:Clavaminate synthase-like protein [Gymnopus androsaceus JB14]|uniref:Clavaminate synthase-like protein n=1 Tax=Gymnopus androsaceus JB14 TaxID=1447944 RepID=A0A6A4HS77_9AGAR|nr:Clavaminate synthase-like protein [Gymnopus androsaceus JB14]
MSLIQSAEAAQSSFERIPIIDLKHLNSPDASLQKSLAREIRKACIDVGFFYIQNHGLPGALIEDFLWESKEFFSLPLESKLKIHNKITPNLMGYSSLLSGNNDPNGEGDYQEGFEFTNEPLDSDAVDESSGIGRNTWPSELPKFREAALCYYHAVVDLGKHLFPMFALALGLEEDFFEEKTNKASAHMRTIHYPPQPREGVVGIGQHTDWECFTILWQEPGLQALEVLNSRGEWINAPPIPGTFVINLGDQFMKWTNGIFRSTIYRAINRSGARRFSIPLFVGANWDAKLEPIPGCVSPERPLQYEVITAGEYVKAKLAETYGH